MSPRADTAGRSSSNSGILSSGLACGSGSGPSRRSRSTVSKPVTSKSTPARLEILDCDLLNDLGPEPPQQFRLDPPRLLARLVARLDNFIAQRIGNGPRLTLCLRPTLAPPRLIRTGRRALADLLRPHPT